MNRFKMKNRSRNIKNRIIISGGGTGGHVFPAIAIAGALMEKKPDAEILFVGAENRLEMEKIPEAGFRIKGLPVEGFRRKLSVYNIGVSIKLFRSLGMARKIIKEFDPDVVVGVGGYASGPVLRSAAAMGIPTLIQEQNSFAGITNKILSRKANRICVAFDGMERFFPSDKIVKTGNPVRKEIKNVRSAEFRSEGYNYFNLDRKSETLLILGGSLGARTINQGVMKNLGQIKDSGIQILWQSGTYYYPEARQAIEDSGIKNIILKDFISRMELAYSVSDVIISRAGAITISELCHTGKPAILVPSPNVAEDHQTRNAMSLVEKSAAICLADNEAVQKMISVALELLKDKERMKRMSENILSLVIEDSAGKIAEEILHLMNDNYKC
jgi:UDP-N-acetylglucosamine--N-acetylmuramyl-(pentapeptide) pyrophosphoryl-undecaprenol N-acetylglucosamine transferase